MFGKSAISRELFNKIKEILPEGSSILEFGAGEGTKELLNYYKVSSVEHNGKYAKQIKAKCSHCVYLAPLENGWYSEDMVRSALSVKKALILIDGPPKELRANLPIDLFKDIECPVIFDDVNRGLDRSIMHLFCYKNKYESKIYKGKEKDFAVCTKKIS